MGTSTETETVTTTEGEHTEETTGKPEVDWKARSREWEKRAKANADAAKRLAEIEESQKSEQQKLTDAKTAAEEEAAKAKAEALRWRIAAKHKISDDDAELFLTGTDEETLERQAKALAERTQPAQQKSKTGNYVPAEGTQPNPPGPDPLRDLARQVFGRPD